MAIKQGVTPTITFTLPQEIDLTEAENVYLVLKQGNLELTKSNEELTVQDNIVSVYLTQAETLQFEVGRVEAEIDWTYADGSRGETDTAYIDWARTLMRKVLK